MMSDLSLEQSNFLFYTTDGGDTNIEVFLQDETVWLTLNRMADLFGTSKQNISYHIKNIFKNGKLDEKATVKEILTVQQERVREVSRNIAFIIRKILCYGEISDHPGKVSAAVAKELPESEYSKFRIIQDKNYESDFDKSIKELKDKTKDND